MALRPSWDKVCLDIAETLAKRGTCARRKVGCVLADHRNFIIGTGYNGVASGLDHCINSPCFGALLPPGSGTSLYACEAIHAEQNALLQCKDVQQIKTCYVTYSPCIQCTKLLLNTSCSRVIFLEPSSHNVESEALWKKAKGPFCWQSYKELSEMGYA